MTAKLMLEDGVVFTGRSFGAEGEALGEVVFNTSMSGYQEVFTDPSYNSQIVALTYPLIGNYGINTDDLESAVPQVSAIIVREVSQIPSNFRSSESLQAWLRRHGIPAIEGIDTRMLTRMLRSTGAKRGIVSTTDQENRSLLKKVEASPGMSGMDLATRVTCQEAYSWNDTDSTPFALAPRSTRRTPKFHVVAFDFGVKRNILRRLVSYGCKVTVVPASTPAPDVLKLKPDGIFLSNGPGDPAAVRVAITTIRDLIGKKPVFGICLGHQLLALALGGRTYKLKFGHRGSNHPVKNLQTGAIEITSQNHGFAVDPESLDTSATEITHINLYDGTNEGFRHRNLPVFSVQYHPEASPGPHDSDYLFENFLVMMESGVPVRTAAPSVSPA